MLHTLPKITETHKKRLGRGIGSGVGGHTVGRGSKGHNSRQGKPTPLWFEGGQLPLIKRLPYLRGKFRFKSLNLDAQEVQMSKLSKLVGQDVTPETLLAAGLIHTTHAPIKIIGTAEFKSVGTIRGVALTASARVAAQKAGAKFE